MPVGCVVWVVERPAGGLRDGVHAQLSFTEKGMRKVMDAFKSYQSAVGDDEVLEVFKVSGSVEHAFENKG